MELNNSMQNIISLVALKDGVKGKDIVDIVKQMVLIDMGTKLLPHILGKCVNIVKNIIKHKDDKNIANVIDNNILPKTSSIQIHRLYEKTNENDVFDAIIWRLCQLPQTKHLKLASNGIYVLSNIDIIHIEDDINVKQISVSYDEKKAVTECTIEIFSYTVDLLSIKEYMNDLVHKFNLHRNNQLGQMIYYFDEIPCVLPRLIDGALNYAVAPKFMTFTMSKMLTNKNLDNIYGSAMEIVRKRVKFFMNNKKWYQEKGVPYTLGILMYGEPGCGKTSLIKALSKDCQRHVFNIKLSESTTISQVNTLFFTERVTTVIDGVNNAYNIPLDKRIIVLEDIDCLSQIVLERTDINNMAKPSQTIHMLNKTNKNCEIYSESSHNKYSKYNYIDDNISTAGNTNDTSQKLTLSYLLNVLDGVLETPGRIVIMTSNHPDKLDRALIRPGRIDLKVHFNKCTRNDIIEMIEKITNYRPTESDMNGIEDFVWTPAEVTQKIFECIDSDNVNNIISSLRSNEIEEITKQDTFYTLYKNAISPMSLYLVKYLHFLGYQNVKPNICIERNHPKWVTDFPSILTSSGERFIGLNECARFFVERYNMVLNAKDLLKDVEIFMKSKPEYSVHNFNELCSLECEDSNINVIGTVLGAEL